jgi:DNA-binding PadR family transcriptional regulator
MDRPREHRDGLGTGYRQRKQGRGRGVEFGGPGWGGGRGRMRRGGIRRAILLALEPSPAHGYEVMHRLEERSGGVWRPSPGSVYPTLQMLEDEGTVRSESRDGTRVFALTDKGREEITSPSSEAHGHAPWEGGNESDVKLRSFRQGLAQVAHAARQLSQVGNPAQLDRGIEVVQRARKELYQILSDD